jgi:chaperone BCS1
MEDIDAAFQHTVNRETPSEPPANESSTQSQPPNRGGPPSTSSGSRVSLSGLLNALDGVGAQEGRILYATTNKYSALDPALCRPGRMDLHVEFKLASKHQAQELFRSFYLPSDDVDDDNESEKDCLDSGYSSPTTLYHDSDILKPLDEKLIDHELSSEEPLVPVTLKGRSRRPLPPSLSRHQILDLALRFTQPLPEREFSMASLQGYLMAYKTRPFDAVREFGGWIERELVERAENRKTTESATAEIK